MKRIALKLTLLAAVVGLTGCGQGLSKEELEKKQEDMVNYIEQKYDTDFKVTTDIYEHIYGESGMGRYILNVQSEDGVNSTVNESYGMGGEEEEEPFYDTYPQDLLSAQYDKEIGYEKYPFIQYAHTYADLDILDEKAISAVLEGKADTLDKKEMHVTSLIHINEDPSESILKGVYELYLKLHEKGDAFFYLSVAFNGDSEKAKLYVERFYQPNVGTSSWEEYDESISHLLLVEERDLSFEEFRKKLKKIK